MSSHQYCHIPIPYRWMYWGRSGWRHKLVIFSYWYFIYYSLFNSLYLAMRQAPVMPASPLRHEVIDHWYASGRVIFLPCLSYKPCLHEFVDGACSSRKTYSDRLRHLRYCKGTLRDKFLQYTPLNWGFLIYIFNIFNYITKYNNVFLFAKIVFFNIHNYHFVVNKS